MEMDYASKGLAGAALGTGIAGLSLGVLNGAGGLLNLMGGGGGTGAEHYVNRYELENEKSAERERTDDKMRIATLEAQKYSDNNDIATYKALKADIAVLEKQMADQRVINQQTADGVLMARQEFKSGLDLEAHKRECADNKIVLYANGTFQPKSVPNIVTSTTGTNGTDAVTLSSVTPAYQPLYNPLI